MNYWVTGFGSGGTLRGVSRDLKDKSPNIKIMVCEPDNSQIFIDGEFVGGCTDIFDGLIDKSIKVKLEKSQIEFKSEVKLDPYSLLPSWLHPR